MGVILGLYRDNGKQNGNYKGYRGYIGIVVLYWGYIRIMEKKMEVATLQIPGSCTGLGVFGPCLVFSARVVMIWLLHEGLREKSLHASQDPVCGYMYCCLQSPYAGY